MITYWHILKAGKVDDARLQRIHDEEFAGNFISAGYGNEAGGKGWHKLAKYQRGDRAIVYVPRHGAIAYGEIDSDAPHYVPQESTDRHAHRRGIAWITAADRVADAVPLFVIRAACNLTHPLTLTVRIPPERADKLVQLIDRAARQT